MAKENKNAVKVFFEAESDSAASIDKKTLNRYSDFAVKSFHTRVLDGRELSIPAIAQFATSILGGVQVYETLFFVNVLRINMIYVTAIKALIGIYDVLNDPLFGIVYDRTRTRYGKARPYILLGAVPYFVVTAIMYSGAVFLKNPSGNDPKKILFVFIMLFLKETFATIYNLPKGNLLVLMTPNPQDRITVGLLNSYLGEAGSTIIYAIFLPLMELNNKGYIDLPMSWLFTILAWFAAAIGIVCNIAQAVLCKERVMLQAKPAPIEKSVLYVLKNKYMLRNFAANFATSWWSSGGYSWDVVTQQEIFGGTFYTVLAYLPYNVLDVISVTFIPKFAKIFKHNNRNELIALRMWDILCVVGMWLGIPFVDRRWVAVGIYAFFYALTAINNGPANVVEGEIGREINDYTEYVTGERPDGTIHIITNLILRITAPLNAMFTIFLFKWSGYDTTLPMLPWAQENKVVYQKVWFLFNGITILPRVIKVIPYFFYDLVGEKREQMYIELNERRALLADKDEALEEGVSEIMETLSET
ncbi:MAG: MFS transporter [Clostridia bacterium]|nr:MFS transporter [Clostridia bacterium]